MNERKCNVRGCQRIKCELYSETFGYICRDHFDKLVKLGPATDIEAFFQCRLGPAHNEEASRAYFSVLFPYRKKTDGGYKRLRVRKTVESIPW